jgi:hypothetical protein
MKSQLSRILFRRFLVLRPNVDGSQFHKRIPVYTDSPNRYIWILRIHILEILVQ